jgi:hypothetical protein
MEYGGGQNVPEETTKDPEELENRLIAVDTDLIIDILRDLSLATDVLSGLPFLKHCKIKDLIII